MIVASKAQMQHILHTHTILPEVCVKSETLLCLLQQSLSGGPGKTGRSF